MQTEFFVYYSTSSPSAVHADKENVDVAPLQASIVTDQWTRADLQASPKNTCSQNCFLESLYLSASDGFWIFTKVARHAGMLGCQFFRYCLTRRHSYVGQMRRASWSIMKIHSCSMWQFLSSWRIPFYPRIRPCLERFVRVDKHGFQRSGVRPKGVQAEKKWYFLELFCWADGLRRVRVYQALLMVHPEVSLLVAASDAFHSVPA